MAGTKAVGRPVHEEKIAPETFFLCGFLRLPLKRLVSALVALPTLNPTICGTPEAPL